MTKIVAAVHFFRGRGFEVVQTLRGPGAVMLRVEDGKVITLDKFGEIITKHTDKVEANV